MLADEHFKDHNVVADVLAVAAIVTVFIRTGISLIDNARLLEGVRAQSMTDDLTGLGNRRGLLRALERQLCSAAPARRCSRSIDLNGFKRYNDTYGHPSGDALLLRLATRLAAAAGPSGHAFRLGGDEFCLLVPATRDEIPAIVAGGLVALTEESDGFSIDAENGSVVLPDEAQDPTTALRLADERLYEQKYSRDVGEGESHEVLLRVLEEREPGLREHMRVVAELSSAVGVRLGLRGQVLDQLRLAAELHDVGKLAIPVDVLQKPGVLTERGVDVHPPAHRGRRAGAPAVRRRCARSPGSCARHTSAGTARAMPTGSPATRSRFPRGSSPSATPTPQ